LTGCYWPKAALSDWQQPAKSSQPLPTEAGELTGKRLGLTCTFVTPVHGFREHKLAQSQ